MQSFTTACASLLKTTVSDYTQRMATSLSVKYKLDKTELLNELLNGWNIAECPSDIKVESAPTAAAVQAPVVASKKRTAAAKTPAVATTEVPVEAKTEENICTHVSEKGKNPGTRCPSKVSTNSVTGKFCNKHYASGEKKKPAAAVAATPVAPTLMKSRRVKPLFSKCLSLIVLRVFGAV